MDEFLSNLLPGNYWLTKSMEFSRSTKSGTLWYLKKWFVYYHYIFFKQVIHENDFSEIISIFDSFIESLDPEVREDAKNFFYETDIRSDFTRMTTFCNTNEIIFESEKEQKQFQIEAKKFYFMYLMKLGGQSGYKKEMLELINQGVVYSEIKNRMTEKMSSEGHDLSYIRSQFSDFHAVIRNERQIFFYYGLFNGSDKADLSGFYTMTRVGKSIVKANQGELVIIWEHQKIKMLSQSPETKIEFGDHEKTSELNYSKFGINYHPYLTLLKSLSILKTPSKEKYQFLVARLKNSDDMGLLLPQVESNPDFLEKLREKVTSFNRNADIQTEDFNKELKKFTLGISNLPLDNNTNPFSFLSDDGTSVTNAEKMNFVVKCYGLISKYLDENNESNYKNFENSLKEYYISQIDNKNYEHSPETLYEWHKYIINLETSIVLPIIYVYLSLKKNKYEFNLTKEEIRSSFKDFKWLLNTVGISKQDDFIENIQVIQTDLSLGYLKSSSYNEDARIEETAFDENIDERKLSEISTRITADINIERKRSHELIGAVRSYYLRNFKVPPENLIMCDACNEKTFTTKGKYAYLEFHHIIPFSTDNGPDHYLNIVGICPMCHRKFHFATKEIKKDLYNDLSEKNNPKVSIEERFDRLYNEGILEPLNIEFLRKEGIISDSKYNNYMDQEVATIQQP